MAIDDGLEAVPGPVMANANLVAHFDSSAGFSCLLVLACRLARPFGTRVGVMQTPVKIPFLPVSTDFGQRLANKH
ncbi:hypothetical protein [Pseudomonas sp. BAY1663]|uniref:hypothetical protein n=1 Tax=Pseudomonas sp. BAY1663 TaxID=1439940 RepID=UPI0013E40C03|nr:hypothetical protein [Pseudomonas sp. BAY1663]